MVTPHPVVVSKNGRRPNLSRNAQQARVLAFLQRSDDGLNRYEAEKLLHVCHLAARIMDLKRRGHAFITIRERAIDPHGVAHHHIARYRLLPHQSAQDN